MTNRELRVMGAAAMAALAAVVASAYQPARPPGTLPLTLPLVGPYSATYTMPSTSDTESLYMAQIPFNICVDLWHPPYKRATLPPRSLPCPGEVTP